MKLGYKTLVEQATAQIKTYSVQEALARLDDPGVQFVDVRDVRELEREGMIPGAFHAPRGMIEFWIDPDSPYFKPVFGDRQGIHLLLRRRLAQRADHQDRAGHGPGAGGAHRRRLRRLEGGRRAGGATRNRKPDADAPHPAPALPLRRAGLRRLLRPLSRRRSRRPDALELMRSRYSAYVLRNEAYLQATWHPDTRPAGAGAGRRRPRQVARARGAAACAGWGRQATVEFVARYKLGGRARRLHEVSRFVRVDGRWLYVDGGFPSEQEG